MGNLKNSAPCINCLEVIKDLNIKKLIFSLDDGFEVWKPREFETSHISMGGKHVNKLKEKEKEKEKEKKIK